MGLSASPRDDGFFTLKGDISCETIACPNWSPASLPQIITMVNIPTDLSIYSTLTADPDTNILRTFSSTYTYVEPLRVRKNIYLPTHFVSVFFKQDLASVEAWTCLHSAIVERGLEVDCHPIIDWICVALTLKNVNYKLPLEIL